MALPAPARCSGRSARSSAPAPTRRRQGAGAIRPSMPALHPAAAAAPSRAASAPARHPPSARWLRAVHRLDAWCQAAPSPHCADDPCGDPADRPRIRIRRTEVPRLAEIFGIGVQPFGQHQVAAQRFQHVLPRTHACGLRIVDRLAVGRAPACSRAAAGPRPSRRRRSRCRRARSPRPPLDAHGRRRTTADTPPSPVRRSPWSCCRDRGRPSPRSRDRPRATRGSRSTCRWSPRPRRGPSATARTASSTCTVPMTLVA